MSRNVSVLYFNHFRVALLLLRPLPLHPLCTLPSPSTMHPSPPPPPFTGGDCCWIRCRCSGLGPRCHSHYLSKDPPSSEEQSTHTHTHTHTHAYTLHTHTTHTLHTPHTTHTLHTHPHTHTHTHIMYCPPKRQWTTTSLKAWCAMESPWWWYARGELWLIMARLATPTLWSHVIQLRGGA